MNEKNIIVSQKDTSELIKFFAKSWRSLDAYDKETLPKKGFTQKEVKITADELMIEIAKFKDNPDFQKEISEVFAQERDKGSVSGIVGNVFQSIDGKNLYQTVEEQASHLLYFMVKDHPFIDGNKRNGAFAFVWFLNKAKILNMERLTPEALTALTILVAESDPHQKDRIIGLILELI